ncbi:MAG TPA: winged helix-turn-helix domain-containing protein [Terriglobales bacterium]|nr:winged helix-turn-helix domain-containing protein [Terriglobales bacterium]
MPAPPPHPTRWRFGPFELDLEGRQLLENRNPVHIAEQPLRILGLLVAHAGRLVTRQQLQSELWTEGTFVDFETSLNSAMRRLRRVLGDDNAQPRYIATVPGHGYRFIAPVEPLAEPLAAAALPLDGHRAPPQLALLPRRSWRRIATLALLAFAALAWSALRPLPAPRVLRIHALTSSGGLDYFVEPATDGTRLYYLQRAGDHWDLMQTAGNGATAEVVPLPFPSAQLFDVSPDGSERLLGSFQQRGEPMALWRQHVPDGAPIRLDSLFVAEAHWFPDGRHILYVADAAIWRARADGSAPQKLLTLSANPSWLAFSAGGRRLRFTLNDPSGAPALWEWRLGSASAPRPVAGALPRCCGQWTRDGRYFLFSAFRNGTWNLWAQRQPAWPFPWRQPAPVQLTVGPHSIWGAFTARTSHHVVFYQSDWHEDPQRLDLLTHQFRPLLPGEDAFQLNYSRDSRQVAYMDTRDSSIWAGDVSPAVAASGLRQLTLPGANDSFPRWSPDGRWIAYASQPVGQPTRAYVVSAAGGASHLIGTAAALRDTDESTPDWSPDGTRLVVALERHRPQLPDLDSLALVQLATGQLTPVPGSEGLSTARWSPDGSALAAFSDDQHRLEVYQFASARWQVVATGTALSIPEWSADGRYLYYQDLLAPGEPLFRLQRGAWRPQLVADFSPQLRGGVHRCGFLGLMPDGSPMVSFNRAFANLRRATLDLP